MTQRLGARIANLEVALAHEQAAKEAYQHRIKELEQLIDEEGNNVSTDNKKE